MERDKQLLKEWALEQNPEATAAEVTQIRAGVYLVEVYHREEGLVEAYLSGFGPQRLGSVNLHSGGGSVAGSGG